MAEHWAIPLYPPVLVAASVLLWRTRSAWHAARSLSGGRCLRCDYDLRATPGRCPECGALPPGDRLETSTSDSGR